MTAPLRRRSVAMLVAVGVAGGGSSGAAAGDENPVVSEAASGAPQITTKRDGAEEKHTQFFPLPLYATSPSEGGTYGAIPVFMRVDGLGRTSWILAPSVSWNSATKVNATFRYYSFARDAPRQWTLIVAASQHTNRSLRYEYRNVPGHPYRGTFESQILARQSLFYRYFGLGPDTVHADQSSYVRQLAIGSARAGLNLLPHFNLGVRLGLRWDRPRRGTVFGLPATQDRFPTAPGLDGAALATTEVSLRYDTREKGDYDTRGVASELHLGRDFALAGTDPMWRFTWHTRVLVPEASFLTGAARVYWTDERGGHDVPFYYRSSLGGDTLFRGFTDDRFIDRSAWEAELEQRFLLFTTHLFHVTADWRADPFVAFGQVFPDYDSMFSHVRKVVGVGLRAFVHPNVLGRVDVAYGSDGATAYVILGYPY
jgi:hypothetical protein